MISSTIKPMHETPLPYGTLDLDAEHAYLHARRPVVRCYVRGCRHMLTVPTRGIVGDVCPDHGIRCHHSFSGPTYTYAVARRNIIASADTFQREIVGHPFKYESHRLGYERSEDALSWNVFRSLQEAKCLHRVARHITGVNTTDEPFLYLWGICTTADAFAAWNLLIAARNKFESALPVERPLTEPDIALHLPGRYLILIEAKFTSENTFYDRGPRRNAQSLTLDELLGIYNDPTLAILNLASAQTQERIYYQLWRNTIFAEWMARLDDRRTRAYHVNLVREGYDQQSASEFGKLVNPGFEDRFQRMTWEQIYHDCADVPRLGRLCAYLRSKTAGLRPAFRLEG